MVTRVTDNWWMLRYEGDEGRFVWFGQNEAEVIHKYAAWVRARKGVKT